MKGNRYIGFWMMMVMLLLGTMTTTAWATDVTYHILTLPIDNSIYHMKTELSGKRLEAVKVTITGQSSLELPAQYKSPLAENFKYYATSSVTKSGSSVKLFDATNNSNSAYYYTIKDGAAPISEGSDLPSGKAEYYVVYEYNASNEIVQLDGSVSYNIKAIGYDGSGNEVEKGFFALNRGRNNRPAVLPKTKVDPEMLASEDFMKVDVTGTKVSPYWDGKGDQKNKRDDIASKFYFIFKFAGSDPYNIIIQTAYNKDTTYIEKNDNSDPAEFVYKYYKGGSIFANGTANCYIASDEHRHYNYPYDSELPENPTELTEGSGTGYDTRMGYYHGQKGTIWNSFALLNNSRSTGLVFMATRTGGIHYLKEKDQCNNLQINTGDATDNLTIKGLYPIKKLTFKVVTPFYKTDPSTDHIISVSDWVSQYTVDNDVIETKYLPDALKRKYIQFNGKFYKDAACTQEITNFSDAIEDPIEGYQVYVGYNLSSSAPKFLSPSAGYTAATWYELTDDGSVQESGRKIKNNSGTYKNNGANGEYVKESEFALVGDPYELNVLYRKGTEDAGSNNYVALSGHNTWDMPDDDTDGSFLLREYKGTGYWSWDAGHTSVDVEYQSSAPASVDKNAQTITINLSGLDGSNYVGITIGGADASQIESVTPEADNIFDESGTTVAIVVKVKPNTGVSSKTMTVTIQEYNDKEGHTKSGAPSVITITQSTASSSFAGNTVTYSTTSSTRVKVLDLPKRDYTYNIVDKSGRVAAKATASQTIFSTLSVASIPSIIVSPFILDETVTFCSTFDNGSGPGTGTSRKHLHDTITQTPNAVADIYVRYTTARLEYKPIKLNENQEFNVVLNGRYLYFDGNDNSVKTQETPSEADLKDSTYLWKLRNKDPYAMLVDNLGARKKFSVAGQTESVTVYDDDGGTSTQSREKGAWVDLASIVNEGVISFITTRADAQRFVAKASVATGVYEVMVATGRDVDASTTYYNIGRPEASEVKIYNNSTYPHGDDELMFHLEQSIPYKYYLIDKAKHELLTMISQNTDLALLAEYQSPLVDHYTYYAKNNIHIDDKGTASTSDDEYTPINAADTLSMLSDLDVAYDPPTESNATEWGAAPERVRLSAADSAAMLSRLQTLDSAGMYYFLIGDSEPYAYKKVNVRRGYRGRDIYVTYETNNLVKFNTGSYMLKFLEPFAEGYYLEDGNDKLTADKIQAVYPYCNGDGNLNIYGDDMQKEQFNGGASTRPRWVWYFVSDKNDPYHVRIRSRSTISYNGVANSTYLTTYAVHFNQDAEAGTKHIVTGGTLPGVASATPTEYMVLGSRGKYKLLTTSPIDDGTAVPERRRVNSFEQYWKTYNMAKLHVLGISKSTDAYSTDTITWVVPPADSTDHRATLTARGWHSYSEYANAVRWNGYNDKSNGHEKKVVEKLEHWYQTFSMGTGIFDIESADIPAVLVLLDLHGWEIMRLPLPTANYPEGEDELAALRAYDSPWVKEYKFYSQATKATGCHKYTLRLNDDKSERDQIKVNGVHYTSTSLGALPPVTASGVKSGGAFNDQFVTYTVKEEYAKSYQYTFNDNGKEDYSESGEASKFLILLGGRFFRDNGTENSYFSKPIYEASNPTGGNIYDVILDPCQVTVPQKSTSVDDDKDGIVDSINLWYVGPNLNIDVEMGIKWGSSDEITASEPLSEYGTKKKYKDITGFDPYNIQLKNAANSKYVTAHQDTARLYNGIMTGVYVGPGDTTNLTLAAEFDDYTPATYKGSEGYDHTYLQISNQTFMAVSDANGNMQFMPRFDHTKRVNLVNNSDKSHTTLQKPVNHEKASADKNSSIGPQTIFFVRPQVFEYHIIDNSGKESLRYKRAGDYFPAITDHFKSPFATDFTYYTGLAEHGAIDTSSVAEWGPAQGQYKRTLTRKEMLADAVNLLPASGTYYYRIGTRGNFGYWKVTVTNGLLEQQITGTFAEAGLNGGNCQVQVRYQYDESHEGDKILEGKWYTVKLANKDLQASGEVEEAEGETQGTGVSLYADDAETPTKPSPVSQNDKVWQWKFLAAPTDPSSDYYVAPDPYDVQLFNRHANYTTNPSVEPSPMAVGIKVPSANGGADHFALLSHPDGGYALAVAGIKRYTYKFLNGETMTTSVPADTVVEEKFTQKYDTLSAGSQVVVNDDVKHSFTYNVINHDSLLAVRATQDDGAAELNHFAPTLPDSAQTPLLDMKDYTYYGFAQRVGGKYNIIPQTILHTLYGLYDDTVYVSYKPYNMDSTSFKIPNKKTIVGSHVARDSSSVDVAMNINGELPYNIIWYNDNMMESSDNSTVNDGGSKSLSGNEPYVWFFTGNDPYALKIKHKGGKYLNGTTTLVDSASAPTFMLLKKEDYDYGVLQVTGITGANAGKKLTGFGGALADAGTAPTKFIVFGLSVHDLIYRLIIAKTGDIVTIPYREGDENTYTADSTWKESDVKQILGTTQRDLLTKEDEGNLPGSKYQLGDTVKWNGQYHTYCYDAGSVSIGDELVLPNIFSRPNCTFEFFIEGVYNYGGTDTVQALNNRFKGLNLNKLMSASELINKTVVVNIVYAFDTTLATNSGLGFVTSTGQNLWYTFETQQGATPYLAHYTNAWGLQSMAGAETRYTNDYLWTPLGDVYGFKMYNRYMLKNSGGVQNVMTMKSPFAENDTLLLAEPGPSYPAGNEIFELIKGDVDGYFRVHPVINTKEQTQYYVRRDPTDNYTKLSTTPCDWTFGLDMNLLEPYYERAGYVGGLTDAGKAAYEAVLAEEPFKIIDLQAVVYNDANIVHYEPGYYRLHNQPGVSSISPVRYASGYLHDIEKTAVSGGIPMHFYSKEGVNTTFEGEGGLSSGFTKTPATRGDIPVLSTQADPSTIFYFAGTETLNGNPRSTMQTQGLYVAANANGDAAEGRGSSKKQRAVMSGNIEDTITFSLMDIGGAVLLIHDGATPATRRYLNYDQSRADSIYDLRYYHESPTDDAKWCMQPVQKNAVKGNGEMPLTISTHNGGDDYYYATFYAPFDVLLPNDNAGTTYNAYICKKWHDEGVNPVPVPAHDTIAEGKFIPAGTPVIIRTSDESGSLTLTLPTASPSTPLSCVFTGSYLEKLLPVDAAHDVYTFGLPMTSDVHKDEDYVNSGDIIAPLPEFATSGVGFYINATRNKEADPLEAMWLRNNRYVQHNKVYYRGTTGPAQAPKHTNNTQFVPVNFGEGEEEQPEESKQIFTGLTGVYDIMGRKVASEAEVKDGSWRQRLAPGIYIVGGEKIYLGY